MKVDLLHITSSAEKLIEICGRTSYKSWGKMTETSHIDFIKMLIKEGHESVFEHASATFRISGVSRAMTHQLVRHRLASYTQVSQRYVDHNDPKFVTPSKIAKLVSSSRYSDTIINSINEYSYLQMAGIKKEDARFVLPNATETEIVMTANMREWRHFLALRGKSSAQWEIRQVALLIFENLKKWCPTLFSDFQLTKHNTLHKINYSVHKMLLKIQLYLEAELKKYEDDQDGEYFYDDALHDIIQYIEGLKPDGQV